MDKQAATIITNHGVNQIDGDDNGNTGEFWEDILISFLKICD